MDIGTNGGTATLDLGTNGGSQPGTNGTAPPDWTRVSDLADELGRSPRWLREWVAGNVQDGLQKRVRRPGGGAPELWAAPAAVAQLRDHFGSGTNGGTAPKPAPELPLRGPEPTAELADGWRAAVDAERSRADAADALARHRLVEADSLRHELGRVRVELEAVQRKAEEAEAGRNAAERRLEGLRADVWEWVAQVRGLGWWKRLRWLPDPPAGLVAHNRLLEKLGG